MNRKIALSQILLALSLSSVPLAGCAGDVDSLPSSAAPEPPPQESAELPELGEVTEPVTSALVSAPTSPETTVDSVSANAVVQAGFFIDPEKSVLIRAPAIVDNGTRTLDPCDARRRNVAPGPVATTQTWTFGHLMTQMANGRSPALLAYNWLANWAISTRVNGDDLRALRSRDFGTTLPARIFDAWQRNSNGTPGGAVTLAMNRAPFRLLAIANRFDLRKNRRFGEGNSGELRFIFSVLDLDRTENNSKLTCLQASSIDAPNTSTPGDQLLILEYAVDHLSDAARRDWILKWTNLTNRNFTDLGFATDLEALTQTVVRAGAGGSRPNGSALIRLRTNESADGVHWDLREFAMTASGNLEVATIKQTPKSLFTPVNAEPGVISWIFGNGPAILNDTHTVPTQHLGSHSTNTIGGSTWLHALTRDGVDPMVAYEFSRRTCVGCHSADTGASFFHVRGRPFNAQSEISHFLDGNYPNQPFGCPMDPNDQFRCFNEFGFRVQDILSYLNGGG